MDALLRMYMVPGQAAGVSVVVWRNVTWQDVAARLLFPFDTQMRRGVPCWRVFKLRAYTEQCEFLAIEAVRFLGMTGAELAWEQTLHRRDDMCFWACWPACQQCVHADGHGIYFWYPDVVPHSLWVHTMLEQFFQRHWQSDRKRQANKKNRTVALCGHCIAAVNADVGAFWLMRGQIGSLEITCRMFGECSWQWP